MLSRYHLVEVGTPNTPSYRMYMRDQEGHLCSMWHDIPLLAGQRNTTGRAEDTVQLYNMIVKSPRYSNARFEVKHDEDMNPIAHATNDDGTVSFAHNVFPWKGYPFNYGYFPQTWTDNRRKTIDQIAPGDGDVLDAIDITQKTRKVGDIVKVKVLGATGFIINNQLDWKIICIEADDPLSEVINEVSQVEPVMPGVARGIHEFFWFFDYPITKELPMFAFKGHIREKKVVDQMLPVSHGLWKNIIVKIQDGIPPTTQISCRILGAARRVDLCDWEHTLQQQPALTDPAPEPDFVNSYYYIQQFP